MKVNITAGECLNKLLSSIYKEEIFIPFNEAMIEGSFNATLFSDEFIKQRAFTHQVSVEDYKKKLNGFLNLLKKLDQYNQIILWFGDEPFCKENTKIAIEALRQYGYKKKIVLHIVNEETTEILKTYIIQSELNFLINDIIEDERNFNHKNARNYEVYHTVIKYLEGASLIKLEEVNTKSNIIFEYDFNGQLTHAYHHKNDIKSNQNFLYKDLLEDEQLASFIVNSINGYIG